MLIKLKNKDTLIFDEFKFKCSIGKNGLKKNKIEGDKSTPKGIFSLGKLYYRSDRVPKPESNLTTKKITINLKSTLSIHFKIKKELVNIKHKTQHF